MFEGIESRRADFVRRAEYAPGSVYVHQLRSIRYIPVHHFSDESDAPPSTGHLVDAWCEFPTDVALVESLTVVHASRRPGMYFSRDARLPMFLKIQVVMDRISIRRVDFEEVLRVIFDHPLASDGFSCVLPGHDCMSFSYSA